MPRRIPDYPDAFAGWNAVASYGSYLTVLGADTHCHQCQHIPQYFKLAVSKAAWALHNQGCIKL